MSQQHHLDKLDDLSGSNAELIALTPNLPKEDVMKKEISVKTPQNFTLTPRRTVCTLAVH